MGVVARFHQPSVSKKSVISYVVHPRTLHQSLYFTGTIQPIQETALTCPVESIVEKIHFNYGQLVTKDDIIMTLHSNALEKQYNEAFTDYLKTKDNFTMTNARFNGTQELWDTGLISKNNYLSEQSSLHAAHIALLQSTMTLMEMREKIGDHQDLSTLNIDQFNKIQQALHRPHNLIRLKAPVSGVLLYSLKAAADKASRIQVATSVKAGDVLAIIGDVTGVRIDIDIPETDIDKVQVGMPAHITGIALGKLLLKGTIVHINTQATTGGMGNTVYFNTSVEVRDLTLAEIKAIKIGVNATIELICDRKNQLLIPIKYITQMDERKVVTVLNTDGSLDKRSVMTGTATADKVCIEQGLKSGDRVIF